MTPLSHTAKRWTWIGGAALGAVAIVFIVIALVRVNSAGEPTSGLETLSPTPTETSSPQLQSPDAESTKPSAAASASPTSDANDPGDGVARDPQPAAPTETAQDGRIQATVILTRWGGTAPLTAGGYVEGVVESGGTCTVTAAQGDVRLMASGPGVPGAKDTDCGEGLAIADARLTSGTWSVQLSYSSDRHTGASAVQPASLS